MNRAFTLTEILVVIAIIATVAAIMFGALSGAKEAGNKTSCVANEAEVAMAMHLYMTDSDGAFPVQVVGLLGGSPPIKVTQETATYYDLIHPYLRGYVRCPDLPLHSGVRQAYNAGYCMNGNLNVVVFSGTQHRYVGKSEHEVHGPALTILTTDCRTGFVGVAAPDGHPGFADTGASDLRSLAKSETEGQIRHHGGANYSFVDGHVRWLQPDSVRLASDGANPSF